jgi:hypothetical protein
MEQSVRLAGCTEEALVRRGFAPDASLAVDEDDVKTNQTKSFLTKRWQCCNLDKA